MQNAIPSAKVSQVAARTAACWKPKPSGKKSTKTVTTATDINDVGPGSPQGQSTVISDNVIDPALLRTTSHRHPSACPIVMMADNLTLEEAQQYRALGKCISKKWYWQCGACNAAPEVNDILRWFYSCASFNKNSLAKWFSVHNLYTIVFQGPKI